MLSMAAPSELVGAIDELACNDLQGLRDWYFGWLRIGTIVVAVGVIREEADEFGYFAIGKRWTHPEGAGNPNQIAQ
jgi:hypothetical protein